MYKTIILILIAQLLVSGCETISALEKDEYPTQKTVAFKPIDPVISDDFFSEVTEYYDADKSGKVKYKPVSYEELPAWKGDYVIKDKSAGEKNK